MAGRTDIDSFSITDGKISNQAKIKSTKLAPASEGQILIAGSDGKFRPGELPATSNTVATKCCIEEPLPENSVKIGKGIVKNGYIKISNAEPNSIPIRDAQGVLKADTLVGNVKGTASNADLLDNEGGTWYTDVDNHEPGTETSLGTPSGSTGLSAFNTTKTVPKVVYTSDSYGPLGSANILIPHNFGYYPQVMVLSRTLIPDSDPAAYKYVECEVEIENETTQTKIFTSEQGLELKIILS